MLAFRRRIGYSNHGIAELDYFVALGRVRRFIFARFTGFRRACGDIVRVQSEPIRYKLPLPLRFDHVVTSDDPRLLLVSDDKLCSLLR